MQNGREMLKEWLAFHTDWLDMELNGNSNDQYIVKTYWGKIDSSIRHRECDWERKREKLCEGGKKKESVCEREREGERERKRDGLSLQR